MCAWWRLLRDDFPVLSVVARRLFALPCSSSAVERMFSTFGRVHTKIRNRMGIATAEKLAACYGGLQAEMRNSRRAPGPKRKERPVDEGRDSLSEKEESEASNGTSDDEDEQLREEDVWRESGPGMQKPSSDEERENDEHEKNKAPVPAAPSDTWEGTEEEEDQTEERVDLEDEDDAMLNGDGPAAALAVTANSASAKKARVPRKDHERTPSSGGESADVGSELSAAGSWTTRLEYNYRIPSTREFHTKNPTKITEVRTKNRSDRLST